MPEIACLSPRDVGEASLLSGKKQSEDALPTCLAGGPFSMQRSGLLPVGCFSALLAAYVSIQICASLFSSFRVQLSQAADRGTKNEEHLCLNVVDREDSVRHARIT